VADADGAPTAGATVQVWQTASNQLYDVQDDTQPRGHLRATFITDECGAYAFRTILPVSYPIPTDGPAGQFLQSLGRHPFRPARGHFLISAPRYRTLVTHLFLAGDKYLGSDAVFEAVPRRDAGPASGHALGHRRLRARAGLRRSAGSW